MNITTIDEKWLFYDNVHHKKQWIDKDKFFFFLFFSSFWLEIILDKQT